MLGGQYRRDCQAAANSAYNYAKSINLPKDGRSIWVFDIDETALSNLPYYAQPDNAFGAKEYNETTFQIWEKKGIAPPVPAILDLYKKLLRLGYKIVFISGKSESLRAITTKNLKNAGYTTWEKLILKQTSESGTTALAYKSKKRKELEALRYRIVGNMGDQWSDLLGTHVGNRTFKVPDPMFYIG
uniref:Acid phosphatase n=1 Tax=Fagus sylvatica TaxID=28930 RepID=A0A2N9FZF6_FAGSY